MRATRIWRLRLGFGLAILVIVSMMTLSGIPPILRPHVYWLLWSRQYKQAVLSSPVMDHQLLHTEWDGDGWGGTPGVIGRATSYTIHAILYKEGAPTNHLE